MLHFYILKINNQEVKLGKSTIQSKKKYLGIKISKTREVKDLYSEL